MVIYKMFDLFLFQSFFNLKFYYFYILCNKGFSMKKRKMFKALTVALLVMLGTTVFTVVNAQTIPCAPKVKGLHYSAPAYNYSPVLFPNMPFDVIISYLIVDSILRHSDEARELRRDFLRRFNNNEIAYDNDTLNYAYKYLYRISDYDPLLFLNYIMKGSSGRKMNAFHIYDDLVDFIGKSPNGSQKRRILRSPYILHIYVDDTRLFVKDTVAFELKDFTVVYAQILDTIKGQTLPDLNTAFIADSSLSSQPNISEDNSVDFFPVERKSNLIFDYCNQWLLAGGNEYLYWDGKLLGAMEDKDGNPWIKPNREYIVLLAPNVECIYNGQFYYALWPVGGSYGRGMYPIEDGNVLDEGNVWGWGKSVPVDEFKRKLNALIDEMKNYKE